MLPFRRKFCVHHSTMHQVTVSLHSSSEVVVKGCSVTLQSSRMSITYLILTVRKISWKGTLSPSISVTPSAPHPLSLPCHSHSCTPTSGISVAGSSLSRHGDYEAENLSSRPGKLSLCTSISLLALAPSLPDPLLHVTPPPIPFHVTLAAAPQLREFQLQGLSRDGDYSLLWLKIVLIS